MKLKELIAHVPVTATSGDLDVDISGIFYDSRGVTSGGLFVAIQGIVADGHLFVEEAIRRGAAAVVVQDEVRPSGAAVMICTGFSLKWRSSS